MKPASIAWVALPSAAVIVAFFCPWSVLFDRAGWLHEWQDLVGGLAATIAALIAAAIGFSAIMRQVGAEAVRAEADRRRRLAAVRAALPLSLSSLSTYARKAAEELGKVYLGWHPLGATDGSWENVPTRLPRDVVPQLTQAIELTDGSPHAALKALVRELQVQYVRMVEMKSDLASANPSTTKRNVEDYILDAADIYARCSALFAFARFEADAATATPSLEKLVSALHQLGIWEHQFPDVHATADRRAGAAEAP